MVDHHRRGPEPIDYSLKADTMYAPHPTTADLISFLNRLRVWIGSDPARGRVWGVQYRVDCPDLDARAFRDAEQLASQNASVLANAAGLHLKGLTATLERVPPRAEMYEARLCEGEFPSVPFPYELDSQIDFNEFDEAKGIAAAFDAAPIAQPRLSPAPNPKYWGRDFNFAGSSTRLRVDPGVLGPTLTIVGDADIARAPDSLYYTSRIIGNVSSHDPIGDVETARTRLEQLGIAPQNIRAQAGDFAVDVPASAHLEPSVVADAMAGADAGARGLIRVRAQLNRCGRLDETLANRTLASAWTRAQFLARALNVPLGHPLGLNLMPVDEYDCDSPWAGTVSSDPNLKARAEAALVATFNLRGSPDLPAGPMTVESPPSNWHPGNGRGLRTLRGPRRRARSNEHRAARRRGAAARSSAHRDALGREDGRDPRRVAENGRRSRGRRFVRNVASTTARQQNARTPARRPRTRRRDGLGSRLVAVPLRPDHRHRARRRSFGTRRCQRGCPAQSRGASRTTRRTNRDSRVAARRR